MGPQTCARYPGRTYQNQNRIRAGLEAAYLPARVWAVSVLPRWVWNIEWDKQGFSTSIHTTASNSSFECKGIYWVGMKESKVVKAIWSWNGKKKKPGPGDWRRLPGWLSGKESTSKCRRCKFDPWVREIHPLEEEIATHSSILAGKTPGQRSLAVCIPRGHKRVGHNSATEHTRMVTDGHKSSLSPAHPCTTVLSRFLSPRGCALAWEQPQSKSENQSLKQGVSGKEQTKESK